MTYILKPAEIEKRSFEIISEHLSGRSFKPGEEDIIKRVIHTSADFEYADSLVFSDGAVQKALGALSRGAVIVTDTNMAFAGINKRVVAELGGEVKCFMSDKDVARQAKERGVTRAMVSMEKACGIDGELILAVGNAPTALIRIHELVCEGRLRPAVVIGVPVGFVNVAEAKELIISSSVSHIVSRGNKGGSNIAAAIVNALIYRLGR